MGFLNYLGLDDLADGLREFTDGIDELKQDLINTVVVPGEELQNTVNDITASVSEGIVPSIQDIIPTETKE